ncbi:MAG: MBL fold metallo-hydrolase, partial [Armatimonadetes bacterium CG_4_10_14_0_8_um_filter_66_14]
AQYTDKDYETKKGWGHSTFSAATDLAIEAGVKRLGLCHHDPDRTDNDMDAQVEACQTRVRSAEASVACFGVREGTAIVV